MRSVLIVAAGVLAMLAPRSAGAQIPNTFTNLQVLPKDISRAELVSTMRDIAGALGVRCAHCHVGPDNLQGMNFATDERPVKVAARTMLQMVRSINTDFMTKVPAGEAARQQVTCFTCHRRSTKPPLPLHELLFATTSANGVAAAIAQYRKLRSEYLDAGMYDFRELSLGILGTRLLQQKRLDDALEVLRLNAELFPKSAMTQVLLGDTAAQKGDLASAEGYYKRALELDPASPEAKRGLQNIKK
jgi:tetratricopeptide (TPR) repeat protein